MGSLTLRIRSPTWVADGVFISRLARSRDPGESIRGAFAGHEDLAHTRIFGDVPFAWYGMNERVHEVCPYDAIPACMRATTRLNPISFSYRGVMSLPQRLKPRQIQTYKRLFIGLSRQE